MSAPVTTQLEQTGAGQPLSPMPGRKQTGGWSSRAPRSGDRSQRAGPRQRQDHRRQQRACKVSAVLGFGRFRGPGPFHVSPLRQDAPVTTRSGPRPTGRVRRWILQRPADVMDVFVYVVVLNLAIQFIPSVISETFTLSLLTAVLLKFALEAVIHLKSKILGGFRAATTRAGRWAAAALLWVAAAGSKIVVLELVDLVFGDAVSLGTFISVTLLVVALLLSRAAVRRLLYGNDRSRLTGAGSGRARGRDLLLSPRRGRHLQVFALLTDEGPWGPTVRSRPMQLAAMRALGLLMAAPVRLSGLTPGRGPTGDPSARRVRLHQAATPWPCRPGNSPAVPPCSGRGG